MATRDWSLSGPDSLIMDINEVALFFRTHEDTIRRWIAAGTFPNGQVHGGKLTWSGADIAAYLHLRGRYSVNGKKPGEE